MVDKQKTKALFSNVDLLHSIHKANVSVSGTLVGDENEWPCCTALALPDCTRSANVFGPVRYITALLDYRQLGSKREIEAREQRPERKSERVYVRLTPSERTDLLRAAAVAGVSLTDFISTAARNAIQEVLDRHYSIELGREGFEALHRLIDQQAKPSPAVINTFRAAPKVTGS